LLVGLAAVFAPPAFGAATQALMPGVTYTRQVQFTSHGPVVLNVLVGPRPTGLYSLQPILANGTVTGRARVSAMEKALSPTATVAGVNGDYFNFNDGHPSGVVMENSVIKSPPYNGRSSVGISSTGTLSVARLAMFGYWQGLGSRRPTSVNRTPSGDGTAVFTPAWGAKTPVLANSVEAVLDPFPPTTTGGVLDGTVTAQATGGGTPIPPDGAVLMAHGSQAPKLAAETPVGTAVHVQLVLTPDWPTAGINEAFGGGPVVVRSGKPVYAAGEDFLPSQIAPRDPRTGIGQRKNGQIVMLAVDGREFGSSVGLTNFELAQAMVRLGVVSGAALDSGGSTTMAFDGTVLNHPSDPGGERAVKETIGLMYSGVYVPPPTLPTISPNGDGIAERETLTYKVVRSSQVTASLIDPTGAQAYTFTGTRAPGTYKLAWPSRHISKRHARAEASPLGLWHWDVDATDDLNRQSSMQRSFWVNDTLGFVSVAPRSVRLRARGANSVSARFKLLHPAKVVGSIRTRGGTLVRRLGPYRLGSGTRVLRWNGRYKNGRLAYRGSYTFDVYASNAYGPVDVSKPFGVRR
jgi:hypothetical protein